MTVMEMLAEFCSPYKSPLTYKYSMDAPFRVGEFVYATDGKACVRVPASAAPEVGESDKAPPVQEVFYADIGGMTAYPIPPGLPKDRFPCSVCKGDGKAHTIMCPACDGDGWTECEECGAEHDCEDCNGSGDIPGNGEGPCECCNGTGTEAADIRRRIGPVTYLNEMLLDRVRRAGATEARVIGPGKPVYFAWEGGEAVIMPWFNDRAKDMGYPEAVRYRGGDIEAVDIDGVKPNETPDTVGKERG